MNNVICKLFFNCIEYLFLCCKNWILIDVTWSIPISLTITACKKNDSMRFRESDTFRSDAFIREPSLKLSTFAENVRQHFDSH